MLWASLVLTSCKGSTEVGDSSMDSGQASELFDWCSDVVPPAGVLLTDLEVDVDPFEWTALSAVVTATHVALAREDVVSVGVGVPGRDGGQSLTVELDPHAESFDLLLDHEAFDGSGIAVPVLGLYPGVTNRVAIELRTESLTYGGCASVQTEDLYSRGGQTRTVTRSDGDEPGWTWLDSWVYDDAGVPRWSGPEILHVLDDGTLIRGEDQLDWFGRPIVDRTLPSHLSWHHDAIQLPNGNVVLCSSSTGTNVVADDDQTYVSTNDYVVELAADGSEIVNAWDLREYLDVDRGTLTDKPADWAHINTVAYDEQDDVLLVSARYQGVVALTRGGEQGEAPNREKELRWILAPHLDWGRAGWDGNGDLLPADYLLTAVDADGLAYPEEVQQNLAAPDDGFAWPLAQHGLIITERSEGVMRLLTFNNQAAVLFDGEGSEDNVTSWGATGDASNDREGAPYSTIAEYEIDEQAMTVRMVWSWGASERELYASHEGGVGVGGETGNRFLVSTGYDQAAVESAYHPYVVEVDLDGNELSRLAISSSSHSAYRAGRVALYGGLAQLSP